jgi:hypothetical protein
MLAFSLIRGHARREIDGAQDHLAGDQGICLAALARDGLQ